MSTNKRQQWHGRAAVTLKLEINHSNVIVAAHTIPQRYVNDNKSLEHVLIPEKREERQREVKKK